MHPDDLEVDEILLLLKDRTTLHHPAYYAPLDRARRAIIWAHYRSQLTLQEDGGNEWLYNPRGTLIARGYTRIVIGDYGAFIECTPEQICRENLTHGYGPINNRAHKYIWLVTTDQVRTKVYEQLATVKYADYKVGMFYVAPADVTPRGE